jgi:hypothetical protein
MQGGGASLSTLNNCVLTGNSVEVSMFGGGGVYRGALNNCSLIGNSGFYGGGAYAAILNNCTLVGNSADYGGGVAGGTLNNCIVYSNNVVGNNKGHNYWHYAADAPDAPLIMNCCCTTPLPTNGVGNITNEPMLLDMAGGDCHLQPDSPCINAGLNAYAVGATDLDGNLRIRGGTVDIGAYELQNPASIKSYAWLQSYGLPTDGSADNVDTDNDGMSSWQEWIAGTDPTNAASVLRLQAPVANPPGLLLRWSSDTNHTYFVQRATSLKTPLSFSLLRTNISGLAGVTAYTDATASCSKGAAFYRIGTGSTNDPAPALLQMPAFVPGSVTLTWPSVTDRTYYVQRATNLVPPPAFSLLQTNISGLPGTISFTDTNPPAAAPAFYRIGVQP